MEGVTVYAVVVDVSLIVYKGDSATRFVPTPDVNNCNLNVSDPSVYWSG